MLRVCWGVVLGSFELFTVIFLEGVSVTVAGGCHVLSFLPLLCYLFGWEGGHCRVERRFKKKS